jgi:hypothetical protein
MINLQNLLSYENAEVLAIVVDNNDPDKQGRLKIKINGFNDNVSIENLEWTEKFTSNLNNVHDLPAVDDIVYSIVTNGEFRWRHLDFIDKDCIDVLVGSDNYLKSLVVTYKNLAKFNSTGQLFVGWTDTDGFRIIKDDGIVQIRKDNSVVLYNGSKTIHIVGNTISLGSENSSAEPAVLGEQNLTALNMLNDSIKDLAHLTNNMMSNLSKVAKKSPYTAHLTPLITAFGAEFKSKALALHAANAKHFPKTQSTIVNLD